MTEEQIDHLRHELSTCAHHIRGELATLLALAQQLGQPTKNVTRLRAIAEEKVHGLAEIANRLSHLAARVDRDITHRAAS
ncbi:MAG: hypothetical protein HYV02_02880 [Deltaproteobacteria bacterium]|nr:hypothetical protein [Deltaproteobacteria bacterium]